MIIANSVYFYLKSTKYYNTSLDFYLWHIKSLTEIIIKKIDELIKCQSIKNNLFYFEKIPMIQIV